eukprot:tig00001029_g6432.t1
MRRAGVQRSASGGPAAGSGSAAVARASPVTKVSADLEDTYMPEPETTPVDSAKDIDEFERRLRGEKPRSTKASAPASKPPIHVPKGPPVMKKQAAPMQSAPRKGPVNPPVRAMSEEEEEARELAREAAREAKESSSELDRFEARLRHK